MKIKDALKEKGTPYEIPDCNREDLPAFFKEMGYKVGVEIGTAKGVYAEIICKAGLKLYAIDPWIDYADYRSTKVSEWQKELDHQYQQTVDRLKPYDCTIIRKTSMEALNDFADESLDFVYIDGNHEFKYVVEDIHEWSKKVRKGGCISGHDYLYTMPRAWDRIHVKDVLPAYTKAYGIKPWFVVGRKDKVPGEKRDGFRSWFWLK
jgi:hypothetical protein